ncbi:MAG: PKD domain-containing protein [Solirubrobacteraceae bacterium]
MNDQTMSSRRAPADRWRMTLLVIGLAAVAFAVHAQLARAVILPAVTIEGPSEEIVGFGGVAMAEDGTGGLVYLKRVGGVTHMFVARYVAGHWLAPIRVDTEEPFAASWPRIGAADGGELVVVWATPFATEAGQPVQELLSATLGPGSSAFGQAMIVDPNIGEGTGTSPDLAMSSTGQADVVYRVIDNEVTIPLLKPEDVVEQVRVAHFNGERWSRLGAINRDPGASMRPPTQANAPQIAIGPTGNGVVVWQEPELSGVARIWARRLFGSNVDYVMPVSAMSFGGGPIEQDADAPSVAFTRLGQAEVAYRQAVGAGSPLPGPRIFLNDLPNGESASGTEFAGAIVADPSVAGGKSASIGRPIVDLDEKESLRLLYDSNGTPRVVEGDDRGLTGTLSVGSPFVGSTGEKPQELPSASVMNPEGGGVSAWPSADSNGDPAVAVREDFPSGAVQTGLVSGGAGGPISELAVGRSGLGDGLVAFQQGPLGNAAIVAAQVTAPPATFVVSVPHAWIKPSQARIAWEPAESADGPLTYTVVLDGHALATPAGRYAYSLNPAALGDGVHTVQMLATDRYGQETLTQPSPLRIDGRPPTVKITRVQGGRGVTVRVGDSESGVVVKAVTVSFGDGQRASGRTVFHHRYAHPGVYRIVVQVRDKLGNAGTVHELVSAA